MPSDSQIIKSITRPSISDEFTAASYPMPAIPKGGARVKVYFAGACYTEGQVASSHHHRLRSQGVLDTSLFPGYEISGIVDAICPHAAANCDARVGDRVMVFTADDDDDAAKDGYAEYIVVDDAANLIPVPDNMALDVASMLPCGALTAYAAVQRAKEFVERKLQTTTGVVNVLIVGAGGLGLWTLTLANYYIGASSSEGSSRVHVVVADQSSQKLQHAMQHGSYDVIHSDDSIDEGYIKQRIKNVCHGGVDVVIDFVSSTRTISRSLKVLKEGGIILVGGNSKCTVSICIHSLAVHDQSIIGVHRGSRSQLKELVELVADGQIKPPVFSVYPVEDANQVFARLSHSEIAGRAVLRVCSMADAENDSVFFSPSVNQLMRSLPSNGAYSSTDSPLPMCTSPDSASSPCGGTQGHARPPFFLPNTY